MPGPLNSRRIGLLASSSIKTRNPADYSLDLRAFYEKRNFLLRGGCDSKEEETLQGLTYFKK
jgi:hypothetical protein